MAILSLFNRIAFTQRLPAMFWQLPFFISFDKLLTDVAAKSNTRLELLRSFTKKIVRMFFDTATQNPYALLPPVRSVCGADLLFWLQVAVDRSFVLAQCGQLSGAV